MRMLARVLSPVALAIASSACGGTTTGAAAGDAGVYPPPIDAAPDGSVADAGSCASGGSSCVSGEDAAVVDAAIDAAFDAGSCSPQGPLVVAGDYTASDGTQRWLRKSVTAETYTVVAAGAPTPSVLPQLFRVTNVCSRWLVLESTAGAFGRLDWATMSGALGICVRTATDSAAAMALPGPDPTDAATGCAGAAWTTLTRVTP
jgi:hypothetical protein